MRFRKRVKVFPGFYLNFSNSGVSSTIGVKGASINFSKKGTYLNTGIPGTGLYNRQKIGGEQKNLYSGSVQNVPVFDEVIYEPEILIGEIKSEATDKLTSASLIELKETLQEVYKDRIEITQEIEKTKEEVKAARTNSLIANIFLIGFFIKSFKNKVIEKEEYLLDLENQLKNSYVNIDVHFDRTFEEKYNSLLNSYKELLTSEIIWDITSTVQQDTRVTRSAASTVVTRTPVRFNFDDINIIKSSYPAFHFENKNGGDLYIYPAFIIVITDKEEFALIDIKDFELTFSQQRFLEEGKIPPDTKVVDKTWAKVNKNGSPDRRFAGNYEIPIVSYGKIEIKSKSGLNESYSFSSFNKSEAFAKNFIEYQRSL
ncbi:DUF4236 domain-containing protein [uncultured Pontibacter sp.]|uniref:DUF4236 domain-containing protein n=1 Tax=uncultured Pontibacter sp. TaxID=453356 RepID=UPI0026221A84|nr:DUF4236 domain-containing protein [uncultured Pontibacter sp.]